MLDLLKASDVTIYAIGYLEHQSSSARHQQRMQLQRIAAMTGGQAFFPASVKELDKIYEKIQREIAARYSLGYTSTRHAQGRRVAQGRDQAETADLKGAKLRTRPGYFAPLSDRDGRVRPRLRRPRSPIPSTLWRRSACRAAASGARSA